ncbi:MAG: hypothetical protein HPY83_08505 [Anaerolineae bacterium]|nr:hypothetical protein [Anaerolineae bacterium]
MLRRLAFLGLIGLALAGCSPVEAPSTTAEATPCASLWVVYSASCAQCRYIKPLVLRLQEEHGGRVGGGIVLAEEAQGRQLRQQYGIRCTPGTVVLAADGSLLAGPACGPLGYAALKAMLEEALEDGRCCS